MTRQVGEGGTPKDASPQKYCLQDHDETPHSIWGSLVLYPLSAVPVSAVADGTQRRRSDFHFCGLIILKESAENEKGGRGVPCVHQTQGTLRHLTKRVNSVSLNRHTLLYGGKLCARQGSLGYSYNPDVVTAIVGIKFAQYCERLTRNNGEHEPCNYEEPKYVATYQHNCWERHGCAVPRLNTGAGAISDSATACVTVSAPGDER
jgi:hypothetical protein